jgi:hypothetical protein
MLPFAIVLPSHLLDADSHRTFAGASPHHIMSFLQLRRTAPPSKCRFAKPFYEIRHVGGWFCLEFENFAGPRMGEPKQSRMQRLARKRPDPLPEFPRQLCRFGEES